MKSKKKITEEAELFIQHIKGRKYSKNTIRSYIDTLHYFMDYLEERKIGSFMDVDKKVLIDYRQSLKDRKLSDCTLEAYFRAIVALYKYLEDDQKVFVNPAVGLSYLAKKKLKPAPAVEEMLAIMDAVDTSTPAGIRNRTMLEVLYGTGVRREELVVMCIDHVDMESGTIKVLGKGSKERMLPIGDNLMSWLRCYIEDARPELLIEAETKALWVMQGGGRLGYGAINSVIRGCNERAGLTRRVTVHDFRRAFATHMLQNGASPVDLQALLGHSTLKHLSCYLSLTINDLKEMHGESRVGQ